MELRDIVAEILVRQGWSQRELGRYLKTSQQNVNGMRNGRPVWELHWQIFLKMLPVCIELDLIGSPELLGRPKHERKTTPGDPKTGKAETGSEPETHKKGAA